MKHFDWQKKICFIFFLHGGETSTTVCNICEIGDWNYGRECGVTNLHQSEEGDIWNPIKMLVDQMSLVRNIYIISLN